MPSNHSITEIIPGLMGGDSDAARVAWDRFFEKLCRVAAKRLSPGRLRAADDEDVAASAFASVCRRLKRGDYPSITNRDELWRLLARVAERKAYTMLRDEARQKRGQGKVSGESVFLDLGVSRAIGIDAVASAEPTPAFIVEMADTVGKMFSALDAQGRQLAKLKLQGYRNDEIAKKLGRSIATVERKLKLIRSIWSSQTELNDSDAT
jgi:RNA polymerase sigma factor (sigma-70 family)